MAISIECIVVHISDDRKHKLQLHTAVDLARRFPSPIGNRALIAWKDSREASAALRMSMDFLREANQVFI